MISFIPGKEYKAKDFLTQASALLVEDKDASKK